MQNITTTNPGLVFSSTAFTTSKEAPVYKFEINPPMKSHREKVNVLLIGGLNGDEPIGTQMLMRLMRHLVEGKHIKTLLFLECY